MGEGTRDTTRLTIATWQIVCKTAAGDTPGAVSSALSDNESLLGVYQISLADNVLLNLPRTQEERQAWHGRTKLGVG